MIRTLLAHSSRPLCDSLRTALDGLEDVYVVSCATTKDQVHFLLPHCNVVMIGADFADCDVFDLVEGIRMTHPRIKILVMGVDEEPDTIIRFIEAGAIGYILQEEPLEGVAGKLRAVHEDRAIVSPSIAAAMIQRLAELANRQAPTAYMEERQEQLDELTSREREVLALITAGYTNQEIGAQLVIECGTVKNHVHNILTKLDVRSRHEAASIVEQQQQPILAIA